MRQKPPPLGVGSVTSSWNSSATLDEVVAKTNSKASALMSRAAAYRKHGIRLKRLTGTSGYDWTELAEFADSIPPLPFE